MTTATLTRTPPHHNTLTCYTDYKCRLPECIARYNAYRQQRRQAQQDGTWDAFIDAEPVRQHINELIAQGATAGSIARASGLPSRGILDFIHPRPTQGSGKRQRTSPEIAAKILAVTPEAAVRSTDATGSVRRGRALVAAGWPILRIAHEAGYSHTVVSELLNRDDPGLIPVELAQAITKTYNDLRTKRPDRSGVDKRQSTRARNRAAADRWLPMKFWNKHPDAIDDPDFAPQATRIEAIAEDARWLIDSQGYSRDQVAARLGISRDYVDRALRETQPRQEAAA